MAEAPWENYGDDTAVADGPWSSYEPDAPPLTPPSLWTDEDQQYARSILRPPEGTIRGDNTPSWWQRFRAGDIGHKLFGPTDIEREAAGPDSTLIPGGGPGVVPLASTMLKFTSVPPPIASEIRTVTDPFLETPLIGDVGQGITKGIRELALTTPIAPLPAAGTALGKATLGAFAGEFAANLPEIKRAYDEAIARGDTVEAAKIAAETVGGGLLIGAGATHALRGKPSTPREPIETEVSRQSTLTDPESQLVKAASDFNKQLGLLSDHEAVAETAKEGATPDIAYVEGGKFKINVPEFRDWLSRIPEDRRAEAVKSLFNEEGLHAKVQETLGDSLMEQLWDGLSKPEQALLKRSYFGKEWRSAEDLGPARLGHEYMRRVLQWAMKVDPRELSASRGRLPEFLTQKAIDLGLRGIAKVREVLPGETGRTLKWMLDRVQNNLATAKASAPERLSAKVEAKPVEPMKLEDFKEPMPNAPHYPILIERPDGSRYEAYMNGIYDMPGTKFHGALSIGKVMPSGSEGKPGLSHGMLLPPEKVVAGDYPKTATEYDAAKAAGVKPPRTLETEKLSAKNPVTKAIQDVNRKRKAFGTLFRAGGNRKVMDQTFDAAENMANIAGEQMRNRVSIGTKPIEREAALAVIEANGDPAKLAEFERQAVAGGNKDAHKAVQYARNNWQGLQDLATRMKGIMDAQVADENANGISTEYHEAYVPHIYDKDLWMGAGRPFVIGGGGGGGASTGFKKGRTFPTIFDAIEAGYVPESLDVGKLAEHRVKNGQKLINRKQWGESLASVADPTDGKPLATAMVRKARGPGQPGYEVAPIGYTPREIIPGVRVAIHEGYSDLFDAMTGTSRISGSPVGKMLLETEGAIKHGLLMFDTFHASRIMQKQALLTGELNAGKRGQTLLEYADADLGRAVAAKLITPEMAAWVRQNRPVANLLIRNGLNVGRISEALYTSFVRELPVIGTFNKWVFEKLTRGAMLQSGLIEFERISKAMPNLTPEQVAQKVARDLNIYFGNLGRQGLFKSGTAQDLARLTFLAPQWVESMARTEIQGAAQAAKGLTIDPIIHKTILTGSIGKGVAQGLLAYFVGTQLLNLVTRGHPTWQNPEDKHKLDAWIPDLSGKGGHGFFISPFSVVAELTHDMLRYTKSEGTALKAAAKILVNKLSPPGRALKVLLTGKDFDKTQIDSTWGRAKAAAVALAPAPIPLSPIIKGTQYPGQTQRQITASLGFKTEPAESPTQQIADKARDFLTKQGKGRAFNFEPTEDPSYAKLRAIMRRGDEAGAVKMLNELEAQHTGKQVLTAMRNHVRHPFTGSKAAERTFLNSLSDKDAALYDKAREEQKAEYDNFLKLWYSRDAASAPPVAPAAGKPWLNY
jgi:hypothetical protein